MKDRAPALQGVFIPVTGKLVVRPIHIKQCNGLASVLKGRGNFRKEEKGTTKMRNVFLEGASFGE